MKIPLCGDARQIFLKALEKSSVERAFASKLSVNSEGNRRILYFKDEEDIDLTFVKRLVVVAIGKGAFGMLKAFLQRMPLREGCELSGVVISPSCPEVLPARITCYLGGHPVPNEASFAGARAVLELLEAAAREDEGHTFCMFLISGGASAMMELPLDDSISLEDTIKFHRALVGTGASIAEINCVRKHFSAVKGGRLALAVGGVPSLSVLLSDVPASHLDALSSGPTMADSTTVEQCRGILRRHGLLEQFPLPVRAFFESVDLAETPKPGQVSGRVYLLQSSDDLARNASLSAEQLGYTVIIDHSCDDWDYRDAADYLLERLRGLRKKHRRVCMISSGEVVVQMPNEGAMLEATRRFRTQGVGGRNLHFALYCAMQLVGDDNVAILSAGSDGVDGNSVAAGAVVDPSTVAACMDEATASFAAFDSFPLLERLGTAIMTGPTGNNLRDLRILLAD